MNSFTHLLKAVLLLHKFITQMYWPFYHFSISFIYKFHLVSLCMLWNFKKTTEVQTFRFNRWNIIYFIHLLTVTSIFECFTQQFSGHFHFSLFICRFFVVSIKHIYVVIKNVYFCCLGSGTKNRAWHDLLTVNLWQLNTKIA